MLNGVRKHRINLGGLFVVAVLAVALVLVMWFSVQADDRPDSLTLEVPSQAVNLPEASATIQNTQATSMTVFLPLVVRNFDLPIPLFGMQMFKVNQAGGLNKVLATDTYWTRLTPFDWDKIEPTRTNPPTYNWGAVDNTIQSENLINASKNGLETIAVIRFAPLWAQKYPGHYCGPFRSDAMKAWGQFVRELVARYSKAPYNVKYWEMGNEPDIDHVLVGGTNGYGCWGEYTDEYYGGGYYAEMLKEAYTAVKAVDAGAQVLIGGLLLDCDPRVPGACVGGSHGDVPPKFLEGVLRAGGGDYFDIVSFHGYADYRESLDDMGSWTWEGATTIPQKASFIRAVLQQYGHGDKPLLNTEAALRCKNPTAECFDMQANYVHRAYADAMATGLVGQVYFAIINDHWYDTGLVNPDLTNKPAYIPYQVASQRLGGVVYQKEAAGYPLGIDGYTFWKKDGSGHMDLIWSEDNLEHAVSLAANASAYDRSGNFISTGGVIMVGAAPVYVERP